MPTKEEMQELIDHCEWERTLVNGVYGSKVIGPNGSCIFLPFAGYRNRTSLVSDGGDGYYWGSTPGDGGDYNAFNLAFHNGSEGMGCGYRLVGLSVRPITE